MIIIKYIKEESFISDDSFYMVLEDGVAVIKNIKYPRPATKKWIEIRVDLTYNKDEEKLSLSPLETTVKGLEYNLSEHHLDIDYDDPKERTFGEVYGFDEKSTNEDILMKIGPDKVILI